MYDENTGLKQLIKELPCPRPKKGPPCRWQTGGCPKGTPEKQKGLSDRNYLAYQHYKECRAVGSFPEDSTVRRNAAIIRDAEENAMQLKQARLLASFLGH